MEVDCLTLVVLGIFTAETAPGGLPLLAHLAPRVAHQPMALRMLFGCLWKTVPGSEGAGASADPSRLAVAWDEWATAAEAEMGGGLSDAVHGELRAQLLHRVWPTWLPMASTINQGARQSEQVVERLDELSQAAVARSPRQHAGSTETTRSGLR